MGKDKVEFYCQRCKADKANGVRVRVVHVDDSLDKRIFIDVDVYCPDCAAYIFGGEGWISLV